MYNTYLCRKLQIAGDEKKDNPKYMYAFALLGRTQYAMSQ